ncbi:acetyl-CoA carboxylase biotin carboxylase subunit [Mycobacterium montefiorense]|uniref:Biotin-dependent 3-methylcrotonyl-coenzyme A carboxylase alpha1 subunit n=1 Tax=Mycobacterium montefiorense TaxID=154654 RepID=A0AA37PPR7_9MYCO|nr:acetyl/propionyl/methylcrotonyl-CoA carboxylase subunit alpha [Mycobacterium montefiorense]GBG39607.1 acetyl-/propionyl-coenzyme A carboxylase alpha chain [Mycobacterium montefiorense]GKU35478.1 acetyl-/propionyl-coenzyme A carboxylase alpha chain [Mycobacterium montefiorense]GKU40483.1 acetyl-/propionyl-coenzyme A carboxylase alpha chain [Mycobacterium montefiorense]GKU44986.1 acetyl-/propionyl-coenzyme A carboxylase alpha chain [Mycobacterium montefiorense]GKU51136.1 acetyl-/propionyl-coe
MFETVLVANRGEIAVRVIRTLRRLGIRSVAVYSDPDADARHVQEADTAVRLGPAPARESYLNIEKVLDAAARTGAQAIHPGYGFLSENAHFAAACERAGVVFLGPPARAIEVMGDKITAKNAVAAFDVPVVPGVAKPGLTDDALVAAAAEVGYPVLIKPSAGGGGKGMRLVEDPARLPEALVGARREAASSFGDDTLFLERFVLRPRHIEVQVLADAHGNVVHLGERECSLQRRHQKVIEEAPSPLLDTQTRARIGTAACNTARSVDYVGAGTVEFIVSAERPDEFFFMEMNTRLQVEHPVTEAITGLDLVEWQLRVGAGEKLAFAQDDIELRGHAIEARVYAEDPGRGFLPTGGRVLDVFEPSGPGVRVDSSLLAGTVVGSDYDPMLSKVIGHGADRDEALAELDRALAQTTILGVQTNIEFLRFLLADERVRAGDLDTALLEERLPDFAPLPAPDDVLAAGGLYRQWALSLRARRASGDVWSQPSGWRVGGKPAPVRTAMRTPLCTETVSVSGLPTAATVQVGDGETHSGSVEVERRNMNVTLDGLRREYRWAEADRHLWIADERGAWHLREAEETKIHRAADDRQAEVLSPMPGSVIAVQVDSGTEVSEGDVVVVVEAMKMEHSLAAPVSGRVELLVSVGDQVTVDQVLARLIQNEDEGKE